MRHLISFSFLLIVTIWSASNLLGQMNPDGKAIDLLPTIHPIEAAQNHYASLQKLDASKRAAYGWMDTIDFSPDMYKYRAIQYAMMQPHYLSPSQVDYLVQHVNFPANSSEQTRGELDFLLQLQGKRTDPQVERVMTLARVGYWPDATFMSDHPSYQRNMDNLFFECREVTGGDCSAEQYPHTTKLLHGVMVDMRIMEFSVKYHLLRARPYQLEPRLESLAVMGSPSFASGHTLWAYIQAYTFAELMPDKRQAYLDLAYEIGLSREIMGIHYPSDEEAARQLAHRMLMLMWHTETFQKDFQAAKAEWE